MLIIPAMYSLEIVNADTVCDAKYNMLVIVIHNKSPSIKAT